MARTDLRFAPGTLFQAIRVSTERARRRRAVHSIDTDQHYIEQGGVRFLVRSVSALARKDRARVSGADKARERSGPDNPFLPYDPDVFVVDISRTHVGLLNKFNVLEHHLLLVTREFQWQETRLTVEDFEALWACLTEFDGLGFYNGGAAAGASQPHKHLQIVPLPIASEGPSIPMEPLLQTDGTVGMIDILSDLPFVHAFIRLERSLRNEPSAAEILHQRYLDMLDRVTPGAAGAVDDHQHPQPYNLLVTRRWMLLVPRLRECCGSISINALGFAGCLFVREANQVDTIRRRGPMTVLSAVGLSYDE